MRFTVKSNLGNIEQNQTHNPRAPLIEDMVIKKRAERIILYLYMKQFNYFNLFVNYLWQLLLMYTTGKGGGKSMID